MNDLIFINPENERVKGVLGKRGIKYRESSLVEDNMAIRVPLKSIYNTYQPQIAPLRYKNPFIETNPMPFIHQETSLYALHEPFKEKKYLNKVFDIFRKATVGLSTFRARKVYKLCKSLFGVYPAESGK